RVAGRETLREGRQIRPDQLIGGGRHAATPSLEELGGEANDERRSPLPLALQGAVLRPEQGLERSEIGGGRPENEVRQHALGQGPVESPRVDRPRRGG